MRNRKILSAALVLAMCATSVLSSADVEAAKKPTLVKKLSIKVGQTKKITVKKADKKAKLTWKANNKNVTIKKSGKLACKVTGKKAGSAVVTAKVVIGKKKTTLKCKVTVKKATAENTAPVVSETPATSAEPSTTPAASLTPSATPVVTETPVATPKVSKEPSILNNYSDIFPYVGVCANYDAAGAQLQDEETLAFVKKHFNSITLENEMKPDAIIGSNSPLITAEEAKALGYVIPDNYKEATVPQLNLDTIKNVLKFCAKNNIKMRAHTLLWHSQTPDRFFKEGYNGSTAVAPEVMDARLEFYIRTVMKQVMDTEKELTGDNGTIVYAWDATNEYIHRSQGNWMSVYGNMDLKPSYVKLAFEVAYDVLTQYGAQDKVTLFSNDYDTYFNVEDEIALVNFINEGEPAKICGGIGMQSHVDIVRPTIDEYKAALEAFLNTGLEVQITELDVTINFDSDDTDGRRPRYDYRDEDETVEMQADFIKDFMKMIVLVQKNRDKSISPKGITSMTIWGLYDDVSWRRRMEPLLFGKNINDPKPAYQEFLDAANIWYE